MAQNPLIAWQLLERGYLFKSVQGWVSIHDDDVR